MAVRTPDSPCAVAADPARLTVPLTIAAAAVRRRAVPHSKWNGGGLPLVQRSASRCTLVVPTSGTLVIAVGARLADTVLIARARFERPVAGSVTVSVAV